MTVLLAYSCCFTFILQDPILGITEAFLADQNPEKMNLGVVSESRLLHV